MIADRTRLFRLIKLQMFLCFPRANEGLPNVVLEAMQAAALIVSDLPGLKP
jgi:hypothetical protein